MTEGSPPITLAQVSCFDGFTSRIELQNRHNKVVAGKIAYINELAPACGRGCFFFDLYLYYIGLDVTKMPLVSHCLCSS